MKKRTIFIFFGIIVISCSQNPKPNLKVENTSIREVNKDSLEIIGLLINVYKWHELHKNTWNDFKFTYSNDSLSGVDMQNLKNCIKELEKSGFFSKKFILNYSQLGDSLDYSIKKASPKLSANELNFPFEEADSWNGFQDDVPNYWNMFKVAGFKLAENNASLNWWLQGKNGSKITDNYYVEFAKESGKWKLAYLEGFNKQYFK